MSEEKKLKSISICNPCFDDEHEECVNKKCGCPCHKSYDRFIRAGLAAGFTDSEVDFLYEYLFFGDVNPLKK